MWKRVWQVLLLLCVSLTIVYFNVQKDTWLIGWDSTQPELNFPLNLARGFSSAWQEYRGLGVTDGMAHSANLIHLVNAWVIAQIVGITYVRYVFVILSHLLGGVGMYFLLRYVGRSMKVVQVSRWVALSGALIYMLNPYTLQMFYQPLELFVTHFAALPWLTLTLILYVSKPNRRNLGWFALANILTLPQAHVPTLFIVWMMLAGILLLPALLMRGKRYGKQILMVILVSIGIHGFWGLPYIYSAFNNAKNIGEAKINVLSNQEVLLRNDAYGDFESIVKMQGFTLAFEDWNEGYKFGLQMPEWQSWWGQEWVTWVMGGMMILAGTGIVLCMVQRKWWMIGVVLMYILAFGNLGARIPYVREIGAFLRVNIPYYEAIFRFTFTKFALVYAFLFALLMVVGILGLYRLLRGWFSLALTIATIMGVLVVAWPVWQGHFFYHNLKLRVPAEYQSVYKFFNEHNDGRVLPLPYPDFWGWQSNEWGYRGSGFVWQGITNPTLYGAFNAWSPYNEGFYNEFSTALYGCETNSQIINSQILKLNCGEQVARVLDKYDVRYVLLDESVIAPGQGEEILRIPETKRIMEVLGVKQVFNEGFLTVWEVENTNNEYGIKNYGVSVPETYTLAEGEVVKAREDVIFEENGTYVSGSSDAKALADNGGVQYPFASLMREEVRNVEWGEGVVRITNNELRFSEGQELVIPGWEVGEIVRVDFENGVPIPTYTVSGQPGPVFLGDEKPADGKNYFYSRVSEGEEWEEYRESRKYLVPSEKIEIEVKGEPFEYDFAKQGQGSIGNCDVLKRGVATKTENTYFADERGAVCDYVVMEAPFTRVPHLLRLRGENIEGRGIKFFLYNTGSKRNDIEYLLSGDRISVNPYSREFDQTFALLPWDWDGYYTLNIETRSFGERAENKIEPVEIRYAPIDKIARVKLVDLENYELRITNNAEIVHVKKTGTWLYGMGVKGEGLIRLSQGYDEGWVGLLVESEKLKVIKLNHVIVDGWANGWLVSNQETVDSGQSGESNIVIIFYWPQLLQYLGFALLGITGLLLVLPVITKSK